MRRGFLVALLFAVVVGSIGIIHPQTFELYAPGTVDAPPSGGAALPKHIPRPGPVVADLALAPVEAAPGGRLDTQRLLRKRDFKTLRGRIEQAQDLAQINPREEERLFSILSAFASADPTLTPLLDEWVAKDPRSYAPLLARAEHRNAIAWAKRGSRFARETSDRQRDEMREQLRLSVEDARRALRINPRLTLAYRILIKAATAVGDNRACVKLADEGLRVAPASYRIRTVVANCMMPRWGGSYGALTAIAEEAATHAGENPRLASLAGQVDFDRGRIAESDGRDEEAIALYTRAIDAGEDWVYYEHRARSYNTLKRYSDALADLARGLALLPEEPDLLVMRAYVYRNLQRPQDSLADIRYVSELDPTDDGLVSLKNDEIRQGVQQGYELLVTTKNAAGAIRRLTTTIEATGGNGDAFYWRGRAYLSLNDLDRAYADFEEAVRLEPRNIEAYRNIDHILAQKQDWDGVVNRWNRYIELEPLSGQAHFERAGALHNKGDDVAAVADLRKACTLGQREACELAKHVGG